MNSLVFRDEKSSKSTEGKTSAFPYSDNGSEAVTSLLLGAGLDTLVCLTRYSFICKSLQWPQISWEKGRLFEKSFRALGVH